MSIINHHDVSFPSSAYIHYNTLNIHMTILIHIVHKRLITNTFINIKHNILVYS